MPTRKATPVADATRKAIKPGAPHAHGGAEDEFDQAFRAGTSATRPTRAAPIPGFEAFQASPPAPAPADAPAPDFSAFAPTQETAPVNVLKVLAALAKRLLAAEEAMATATQALADRTAEYNKLALSDIPTTMEQAGLTEFTLEDGSKLAVKPDLKVSVTEENRGPAYAWLRKNGHGEVIKTDIKIDTRAMTPKKLQALVTQLEKKNLEPVLVESVHYQTLKSLVKELLEKGAADPKAPKLPPEIGVFEFKKAALKVPTTPTPRKGKK